jgi:hypothetical protein
VKECFPRAAQYEMMRCRPGRFTITAFVKIPDQRRTVSRCAASGKHGYDFYFLRNEDSH